MSNDPFNYRPNTLSSPTITNTTIITSVPSSSNSSSSNNKNAEDLHEWSLYRQNLNANFTESVLHGSSSSQSSEIIISNNDKFNPKHKSSSKMNPTSFILRESTANNILSHPKYGSQLTNQDAFTYLRFGLPRVKAFTNGNDRSNNINKNTNNDSYYEEQENRPSKKALTKNGAKNRILNASAALNDEFKRKLWSSDSNLIRNSENESDSSGPGLSGGHRGDGKESFNLTNNVKNHNFSNRYNPQPLNSDRFIKTNKSNPIITRSTHNINEALRSNHRHHQQSDIASHMSPFNTDNEDDINIDEPFVSNSSLPPPLAKHPHLVVKDLMYEVDKSSNWRRLCGFSRQKLRILEDISFDVHGGELLAIMATSGNEASALLNVLGSRHDQRNGTAKAEIYLNGVLVSMRQLSRMLAYVTKTMHLCSNMSTRQALLFAGLLMGPASRSSTDVKRLTRTLLEELNLGDVRHTKLSKLTHSERKRLHIAMHLLLDTEILMLDQPLFGLDIFDSFFMVEYLRQWAMVGGRVVIMTITAPTYEVFTMIHRVLLISAGRPLFVGPRKDFLKYFNSMGYPCPPYKNPSDYYLDLVTMDDLSQEALIESSQRIETLADMHNRRSLTEIFSSMPGPPAVLPAPFRRANFAMQFLALWIRALIFSFPYNVVHLFSRFMVTLFLSLMIGTIFWQVRTGREQEFVWDRIGFINTMISIGIFPILGVELVNAYTEKKYILSEVHQGLYSLPAYLLAKFLYSAPQTILIGLAYALPACSMAGLQLHSNPNSLPFYLLLMLSYFMALRSFLFATVWICKRRSSAAFLFGTIFTIFLLSSGINIQYRDISITHRWLRQLSPVRWLHEATIAWEFEPNVSLNPPDGTPPVSAFLCSRNPVIQQPNAILVRADCGFQTRANILKWFEYQGGNVFQPNLRPSWHAFVALIILYFGSFILGSIIFCIRVYYYRECSNEEEEDEMISSSTAAAVATAAATTKTSASSAVKH